MLITKGDNVNEEDLDARLELDFGGRFERVMSSECDGDNLADTVRARNVAEEVPVGVLCGVGVITGGGVTVRLGVIDNVTFTDTTDMEGTSLLGVVLMDRVRVADNDTVEDCVTAADRVFAIVTVGTVGESTGLLEAVQFPNPIFAIAE